VTDQPTAAVRERPAASRRLAELINGYQISAAIGAFARLGIADALADGPALPAELAARLGADERSLARLLKATLDVGLFAACDDGRYALTSLGELLRGDVKGSLRRLAIVSTGEWRWRAYGYLGHALRTGEPGFVPAYGCRFWEYLANHPQEAASFAETMSRVSTLRDAVLASAYDFSDVRCLVDVGGGHGSLLCAVLARHPHVRGVLFDLPSVLEGAGEQLLTAGLGERCQAVAGDFLDAVPPDGDAYLLSWVLHDWDDETAVRILRNCRAAMSDTARLLLVELVVPAADDPAPAPGVARLVKQTDLEMLAVVGGRERTAAEYGELLARAGFSLTRIPSLEGMPWSVIEGSTGIAPLPLTPLG
jgi:DNA-binding transcriptional ArsR family regulator